MATETSQKHERVALVTGSGAPRVGNVVARHLADCGYRIIVHANTSVDAARDFAGELERGGCPALAVSADLSRESEVAAAFDRVLSEWGRLDALVNCAAVWDRIPLESTTADDVRRQFEINTLGTFLCCQRAGLAMAEQETGGAIVNVGDWAVARPYRDHAAYFASKGAIETLTRTFALELANRNPAIRVNAILPGPVMLPDDLSSAEREASIRQTLVKREGRPENVAHAVEFLLENDFVTGVCLPVDGGRTVYAD